jgi:hypothetical protein
VGLPGLYYPCVTDIQQSSKNLTARISCAINNTGITVNPQAAGGDACPGVDTKYCGNGQASGGPPGCTVNPCAVIAGQAAGCPSLPCDTSQYQFADIDNKHTVLTGVVNNTTNMMELAGCFIADAPEGDGFGALGNVYVRAKLNIHTGQGAGVVYSAETYANCTAGTPAGGGLPVLISAVRQAPGGKTVGACVPNGGVFPANQGYTGCRDGDGDGCPDKLELSDNQSAAGLRDPQNPFDFFNPEKVNTPHTHTVADILRTVNQFGKDQGNAAYTIDTDRTAVIGANAWNLSLPDGKQTVADILAAVKQFGHNCNSTV